MPTNMPYAQRKAAGLCGHCGKRPADIGIILCAFCRESARKAQHTWAQAHRTDIRMIYAHRKAAGLCVVCGDRPADPLVTRCTPCCEQDRQRKIAWTQAFPHRAQEHRARIRATTARYWEARYLAPGPNLLACCGRWHSITTVPMTTPCCGKTFFTEVPDANN